MCRLVNGMFLDTDDVGHIARTLMIRISDVWEMLGYKDYFDFEEKSSL